MRAGQTEIARTPALAAAAIALATGCGSSGAKPAPAAPVEATDPPSAPSTAPAWEIPEGWRTETIPFPLEFAPGLPYRGVEELRFPKAFLTPEDDWYFSYAFVWHVAAPGVASTDALERDLVAYFRGLAVAVGGAERADIAAYPFTADLSGDVATGTVAGTAAAFDAFKAQKGLTLQFRVRGVPCSSEHERAYVFIASPRAGVDGDPVWTELERLAGAFRCP